VLATVYTRDGRPVLHEGEIEEERARAELAERDDELADRRVLSLSMGCEI